MGDDWSQAREAQLLSVHISPPLDTAVWGDECPHLFPTTMCSLTPSFCLSLILPRAYDVPHPVLGTGDTVLDKPSQSSQVLGRR